MNILGVSCYYHDAAAALLQDGMLIAAAEEERFTRKKHDFGFPSRAIEFCLRQGGIKAGDLDYVVFYEKPLVKFERILMTTLGTYPAAWRVFREAMIPWFNEKLWIRGKLVSTLGLPPQRVLFVDHHMSHAASAMFCSPFDEAAVLTIDGVGEWTTAALGQAHADWNGGQSRIDLSAEIRFPHSLGLLYSAFTAFLGFEVNEGEYKVMGMAPYGEPRYMDEIYKLVSVNADGSFRLNMDYFSFTHSTDHTYNARFTQLFGPARKRESEFYTATTHPRRDHPQWDNAAAAQNQKYADIAASIQRVTEDLILKMATEACKRSGSKRLCMAGGVALNSVANGRILKETAVQDLFIQPAAGDSGGALGAALYAYHVLLGQPRKFVMEDAYWGQGYSEADIEKFLRETGVRYEHICDDNALTDRVVDAILAGGVVGWFQDRFEWGPRALGNRSIMADPRRPETKDLVNAKIKFREPFRPFAPVVLEERAAEYFDLPELERHYPARYMLLVAPIHDAQQDRIGAVNHLGTGRLQTIKPVTNANYYAIVEKFGQATGVPVVLNTSFNLRGEPIVNRPENAWWTFTNSGLDLLVMGHFLIRKDDVRQPQGDQR
jgi:carbamoyltransferase